MRRFWIVSSVVTAAIVLTAGSVLSLNQYKARPLDKQNLAFIQGPTTLRHQGMDWVVLGGWGPSDSVGVNARSGIAATLSVTVTGAPVEFRLFMEDVNHDFAVRNMKPTFAEFDPGAGTGSGSFTFAANVSPGLYTINIEFRSPTGTDDATLLGGSLVVQYGAA